MVRRTQNRLIPEWISVSPQKTFLRLKEETRLFQTLVLGSGLVDKRVHRVVESFLVVEVTVRLHIQWAVRLIAVAFQLVGKIAGVDIAASGCCLECSCALHIAGIGKIRAQYSLFRPSMQF